MLEIAGQFPHYRQRHSGQPAAFQGSGLKKV
jgi:hypothetical protein